MSYLELLKLAAPETILVVTALVVLAADLLTLRDLELRMRFLIGAMISCVGCAAAIAWMLALPQHADFAEGMLVINPLTQLIKVALLVLTIFTLLISIETDFTPHAGEYLALILLAAIGMLFLVSSEDILMLFISLELTSLSLYILTAFNKRNAQSAEAALKYFLFGGMSAAFTLFGLSLLYGLSGSTNLTQIAAAVQGPKLDPMLLLAIVLTVIGFGFKVAAAPFHLWAPDAYQGAPAPSAAFIASGSKVASFFIFAKVVMLGFKGAEGSGAWHACVPGWVPVVALVAAASMVLGNLAAIVQTSVRRLLAYSAIAHAGYMLLAVMSHNGQGLSSLVYYSVTYGLTTLGAFGVVSIVQQRTGGDRLSDFAGLSRQAPVLSFCMMIFMLSLAGIPPLAGFFGKFYVFASAISSGGLGLLWLVILALAMSAVSLYYYLQVLKQIYVAQPPANLPVVEAPLLSQVMLALLALGVVVLGCAPALLLGKLDTAIRLAGL
ncbi:MAG TPA: NADH-quinone oxidoreductase subunit N [Candidatus Binatia bacterium]|jgi:NADH-quinone oxidoreductase subunit N|nr:NADH-quinone oxidoreductase subunit N [Candidatus Binatia bacterium]